MKESYADYLRRVGGDYLEAGYHSTSEDYIKAANVVEQLELAKANLIRALEAAFVGLGNAGGNIAHNGKPEVRKAWVNARDALKVFS